MAAYYSITDHTSYSAFGSALKVTASYSRLGNQGMLQILSLLTIPISQSLFLGHAWGSFDYPHT